MFFLTFFQEEKNLRHKKGYVIIDTKASGVRFQSTQLKNLNEQYLSFKKAYEEKQKEIVGQIIDVAGLCLIFCVH